MQTGIKQAITLANQTRGSVPAYKKFLRKRKLLGKKILGVRDFERLPVTNKKNYIHSFPIFELFVSGSQPSMAYASSGSSGQPTFWFRDDSQDAAGGKLHELIFRQVFKIKKQDPTLVIVCFSMGVWVAGSYTFSSCRWISKQGYKLTTITPGIEKHDIFNILKNLAPKFKNVILAGYPSFVMDVLTEAGQKKIILPKNLKITTAGDAISESWRQAALKHLGSGAKPADIVSIYGSADAGAIAFETPASIKIRQLCLTNKNLYSELFSNATILPSLFQFLPEQTYLESQNQELLLTTKNTIPLIRYNIHDVGNVLNAQEMAKILDRHGLLSGQLKQELANWQLPFVEKYGRTDVGLTYYALNIYPENLRTSIEQSPENKLLSGNFAAFAKHYKNHRQEKFHINLELSPKAVYKGSAVSKLGKNIAQNLSRLNHEFRKLHSVLGERALPQIKIFKNGDSNFAKIHSGFVWEKNKKPKMVI